MSAKPSSLVETANYRIQLEGLEDFFEQKLEPVFARGLSLKQAVYFFGLTKKQLKKRIKNATVPAIQVLKNDSNKWLVYPDGVPEELAELANLQAAQEIEKSSQTLSDLDKNEILDFSPAAQINELANVVSSNVQTTSNKKLPLSFKVAELEKKLANLEYQNGYLESRLAGLEDQVRFFSQSEYSKPSLNNLTLAVPLLILLFALLAISMHGTSGI